MAGLLDAVIRAAAKPAAKPIRVYHSSPYDFDRFDYSKIGQGQGAQSYGHGLYFAESPAVSGQGGEYWKEFSRRFKGPERDAADFLALHNFDREKAAKQTRNQLERNMDFAKSVRSPEELASLAAQRAQFEQTVKLLESNKPIGPRTYEVNINAHPWSFLDLDQRLSRKNYDPFQVAMDKAAERVGNKDLAEAMTYPADFPTTTGMDVLRGLHKEMPKQQAVDLLRESGVPGVRYLDQVSRSNMGEFPGTRNYVVFDDKLLDIMKKYSLPGMMGMTGIGAASGKFAPYFPQQGSQ